MKFFLILNLFFAFQAHAESASLHDISTNEDTTISIKKGSSPISERTFDFVEGSGEISGDPHVLQKTARENWKKSCEDWKKEIKDLNKENQILALSCNAPHCQKDDSASVGSTLCQSKGSYKLKVKVTK